MKFTVTRVHANDVLPLRKEQVEANRTREEAARCGTIHSSTKPETNRIPRQRIGHANGGTVTHGTSTRQPRCRPLTGPAPGGRGAGHSRDQHPEAEAQVTHGTSTRRPRRTRTEARGNEKGQQVSAQPRGVSPLRPTADNKLWTSHVQLLRVARSEGADLRERAPHVLPFYHKHISYFYHKHVLHL